MRIGVPKEILPGEYRQAATPETIRELEAHGHTVVFDTWDADLILKVKQPLPEEFHHLREGQILFTFLHLAANPELARELVDRKVVAIAYETVEDAKGRLPILIPMSQIAGRMAVQEGAVSLEMHHGGEGILLGGVPGTPPAKVTILGGGVVGTEAARIATGMGADVTILDKSQKRLTQLDAYKTRFATQEAIEEEVMQADLLIGAVLIPGARTPRLVPESLVKQMKPGSAIVDVSIDQGGCIETSRPTTHQQPRYIAHDVVHYCVANMPGAVARTGTLALTHATLPYLLELADKGYEQALAEDPGFAKGLNICEGEMKLGTLR